MRVRAPLVAVLMTLAWVGAAPAQDRGLSEAVSRYDPALRLPDQPDLVQRADFDGDGREDVAAILTDEGRSALVVFHDRPRGWQAFPLYADLPAGPALLVVLPAGRYRVLGPQGAVETSAPALELVFPGKASAMYVWKSDRYQVYPTESY